MLSASVGFPLAFAPQAAATTWYVATTGSDGNACTSSASPCLTLAGVHNKAIQPGDVVQVAAGSYAGTTITKSGTAAAKIIWRGHGGTCPTVVNSDPHSRGFRPAPTVTITTGLTVSASYVTVECFKVTDGGLETGGTNSNHIEFLDNAIVCASPGCTGFNVSSPGVSFVTMSRNYLNGTGPEQGALLIGDNITYSYNEHERMRGNPGDMDHVRVWGDTHLYEANYFHGNVFTDNPGAHSDGFQTYCLSGSCPARNITITRNTVFHADEGIITSNSTSDASLMANWTVTNNIFAYPRLNGGGEGGGGFGSTVNVLWAHNTVYQMVFGCGRSDSTVNATVTAKNNVGGDIGAGVNCTSTNSNNISAAGANMVDPANADFHLKSGSPAIDAGATGLGIAVDHDGSARVGVPDIGAYEYGGGGGAAPVVTIGTPTAQSTHDTSATTVSLAGTCTDSGIVTAVSWANDRGGSGSAAGTTNWSITGIPLTADVINVITVTCTDDAKNTGTDALSVLRVSVPATPTDAFTRPTWGTLGANFTNQTSLLLGVGVNQGTATSTTSRHCAFWSAHAFSADHYSQVVIKGTPTANRINYVTVRAQGSGDSVYDHYHVTAEGTTSIISKVIDGTRTALQTIGNVPWADNDTLRLEAAGSTLRAYRNGVQIGADQPSGGQLTAGSAGICGYGSAAFDNFQGGNLGTAAPPAAPQNLRITP